MEQNNSIMIDKMKFVQDTLYVINGKWKLPILISMYYGGNKRFRDIQRSVPKITTRVLSKELKELEANQLIKRTVYDAFPVLIEYTITEYCNTLHPVIDAMWAWGEAHRKRITGKVK
jgi:DNA-binding HxlR family transcriptional regulator